MGNGCNVPIPRADYDPNEYSKLGVKLAYLTEFYNLCGGEEKLNGLSTTQVCEEFVKPFSKLYETSVCEMLLRMKHPSIGIANVFISHAWKYQFLLVMTSLEYHFQGKEDETIIWFDLFSNDQHHTSNHEFSWWCTTFKSAIQDFGHVVLVLSPWEDPIPLTRAWCIWEIYCTHVTNSKFDIAMTPEQRMLFQFRLECLGGILGVQSFQQILTAVDARRAEAWNVDDKKKIFQAIENSIGFNELNAMVMKKLRAWVIDMANLILKRIENAYLTASQLEDLNQLTGEYAQMSLTVGELFIEQGEYDKAKDLIERVATVADTSPESSDFSNPLFQRAFLDLGLVCMDTGELDYAEMCFLNSRKNATGKLLTCINGNLASLYSKKGNPEKAEVLFQQVLKEERKEAETAKKDSDQDNEDGQSSNLSKEALLSMNNLGCNLMEQGKVDEAIELFRVCVAGQMEVLGKDHPVTLDALNNLGAALLESGNYEEALEYSELCYLIREVKLGPNHPNTLLTKCNVANCYRKLNQLDKAIALYEACLHGYEETVGRNNPNTALCLYNLGIAYKDLKMFSESCDVLRKAVGSYQIVYGKTHFKTIHVVDQLTRSLEFNKQPYEGIDLCREYLQYCNHELEDHKLSASQRIRIKSSVITLTEALAGFMFRTRNGVAWISLLADIERMKSELEEEKSSLYFS